MSLFKKKSSGFEDEQEVPPQPKNKGALLVLLILIGGFAYFYFFTSLIVPHEAPPVKAPVGSPEIKQSMPPKPAAPEGGQGAKNPDVTTPVAAPAAPVPAPVAPATAVKPVATPAPQTPPVAAKPAPAPQPAKPAPAPVAAAPAAAKPAAAPAAKSVAAPAAKKEEPKPATTAKKEEVKPVKASAAKPVEAKKAIAYTLLIDLSSGDDAKVAEEKIAKAGIKPLVKHDSKKNRTMNRLYFGAYTDYDAYNLALDKLKVSAKGAFGVEKDGKYYLYAGSFATKDRAEKEKKDLTSKGVTLQIQQVVLPLAMSRITAGQFHSKAEAEKAAAKLAKDGLKASVATKGK
ncbi:MAG: SPOR domain-containing protein [Geobacteraceae bacterium]|nr:SPOR domain-containing protein [Geobacteraceae bacterium]